MRPPAWTKITNGERENGSHRRRVRRLGRQPDRDSAVAAGGRRLPDDGLSRRSDDVAPGARPDEGPGRRLSARLRRLSQAVAGRDRPAGHQGGQQRRGRQSDRVRTRARSRLCGSRHRLEGRGRHRRRRVADDRDAAPGRGARCGVRCAAAAAPAHRQCLSRGAADRGGARGERRHRRHRAMRRQRARPRHPDARVRLEGRRLRSARSRQPGRPCPRMRSAGNGRDLHRLGAGAGLAQHRVSDRGMPPRRELRPHQAGRHRRPRHPGRRRRADPVRGRRSQRLSAARRGGRLLDGAAHGRRAEPGQGQRRARPRRRPRNTRSPPPTRTAGARSRPCRSSGPMRPARPSAPPRR